MPTWLVECIVEGHAWLPPDSAPLEYEHPEGLFRLELRNDSVTPPIEQPTLRALLLLDRDQPAVAEDDARAYVRGFLEDLSLVSSCRFRLRHVRRAVDWTKGLTERRCFQINEYADPNIPFSVLHPRLMETIAALHRTDMPARYQKAIRWYATGVAARYQDEQFLYFWFCLEIIRQLAKDRTRVPTKCPQCGTALTCPSCQKEPMHRPWGAEAIEQVVRRHYTGNNVDDFWTVSRDVRNCMLHGDDPERILSGSAYDMGHLVDVVGKVAWAALLSAGRNAVAKAQVTTKLAILETNRLGHGRLVGKVDMTVRSKDPDNPDIDDISLLTASLIVHGHATEDDAGESGTGS